MTKSIALFTVSGVGLLGLFGWRAAFNIAPSSHLVLLLDLSQSMPSDCDALSGLAQRALALPAIRQGSSLTFFALGSKAAGNEPTLIVSRVLPVGRRATE